MEKGRERLTSYPVAIAINDPDARSAKGGTHGDRAVLLPVDHRSANIARDVGPGTTWACMPLDGQRWTYHLRAVLNCRPRSRPERITSAESCSRNPNASLQDTYPTAPTRCVRPLREDRSPTGVHAGGDRLAPRFCSRRAGEVRSIGIQFRATARELTTRNPRKPRRWRC